MEEERQATRFVLHMGIIFHVEGISLLRKIFCLLEEVAYNVLSNI